MEITIRADQPIKVEGTGLSEPRIAGIGETLVLNVQELWVSKASTEDLAPPEPTDDVFSPLNRPNAGSNAQSVIAPKMPKSSGELVQIPLDDGTGAVMERAVADLGQATQGGGPDSEDTVTTPGPQVTGDPTALAQGAAATGDVTDGSARPAPQGAAESRGARSAPAPTKTAAKKSSRR